LILVLAVVAGLIAGGIRAVVGGRQLHLPELHSLWLVAVAFVPQWFTFYWDATRRSIGTTAAITILIGSQVLLLIFVWRNRQHTAFWWLGLGLGLNLLVICLNGGLMPIAPETVYELVPGLESIPYDLGSRLGWTKDRLLPVEQTILPWLSDRFVTSSPWSIRYAFSIGDVLIAFGAFWLLWQAGGTRWQSTSQELPNE
jgi:hypothetical protein